VKVDVALSLVKSEFKSPCNFEESPYVAASIIMEGHLVDYVRRSYNRKVIIVHYADIIFLNSPSHSTCFQLPRCV
jgi:hypothetical protein